MFYLISLVFFFQNVFSDYADRITFISLEG